MQSGSHDWGTNLGGRSLRTLLIIPFVLQIFATVGLVGYLSFRNGQKAVNNLASQLMLSMSDRVSQQLSSYLTTPRKLSQINKDAIGLGLLNPQDLENMGHFFWKQVQTHNVGYLLYGTPSGEFAGAGYYLENGRVTIDELNPKRYGDNRVHVFDTDSQGNRTKIVDYNENYDFQKEGWYADTLQAGKPVWSRIYQWEVAPYHLSVAVASPVYDRTHQLIGVVGVEQRLAQVSDFLRQLNISTSAKIFILERNGLLVASSNIAEQPFTLVHGKPTRLKAMDSQDPQIREATRYLTKQLRDFQQIQTGQQLTFSLQNHNQFVLVAPWREELGLDWLVVVVIPEATFMEQINANMRNTGLLCLLALAVAILLGFLIARWISEPILELSQASQAIASGDWERTVETQSVNEIGILARSFNQMAQQLQQSFAALEKTNEALEQRVEERTTELKAANQEINQLNQRLKQENLRMRAELDVVRQLQQMILPKEQELTAISDLDIAGFMEAADEVGGDYYDVIQGKHQIRIGIGDVTGHGLESGVLMIMVQTAVRTLLAIEEPDPVKALSALNQVIYQNTQRMNSDKNLSLALLDYQDGLLYLSGQHEEALVVRTNGDMERIDTLELGFPIGLVDDIARFVTQQQIHLLPGDVVVLYTDGITEAENHHRKLYGIEQLMQVIKANRQKPSGEIRQAVIQDVKQHIGSHKVYDDITLVVIKKL